MHQYITPRKVMNLNLFFASLQYLRLPDMVVHPIVRRVLATQAYSCIVGDSCTAGSHSDYMANTCTMNDGKTSYTPSCPFILG